MQRARTRDVVGFSVLVWSEFKPTEHEELYADVPLFDVPQLGLRDVSVGEICLAVEAWLGHKEHTLDRHFFHQAAFGE